jgi:hypothetical protein
MAFPRLATLLLILFAAPAAARDYCPDRPGIGTPPCTIEPGKLSVEMSGVDWTLDKTPDARTDTILAGDLALRYGIADHAELRLGWTPYGHVRSRDIASGAIDRQGGTGDVTIGLKRNLVDPEGKGFSIALLPNVSLPVGGQAIGAGDWGASLAVPLSVPLSDVVSLGLTPQIDAAVDQDRHGRHLSYDLAGGFSIAATDRLNLAIEAEILRDDDPAGATTQALAGASAGLMLGDDLQIDAGSQVGLNGDTPDLRVYVGVSRRF